MAKKKKKTQLSSEGKTELAKAIAEKSQTFVRTYASIENQVSKFFRWVSGWLDKLLFNQKHGKLVALILAILFYITLNAGQTSLFDTVKSAKELGEYKVSAIVSNQAYEVTGLPETVEVTVIGELSDIKNISQQKNLKVVANLTDLTEGTHQVNLAVESAPSRVKVNLSPSTASVTIKKKSIRRFTLGYDYVNRSQIDDVYDLSDPILEQGEVFVRASTDTLDTIAYVKALIEIDKNDAKDFVKEAKIPAKATIVAYDKDGERVKNIDIIPETMDATVVLTKPSKDVPLSIVPTGIVPNNKAIESYTLDKKVVTIYGKQAVLDTITELPTTIPASTLSNDREFSMPIILPTGISKASDKFVNITIKLADMKERQIESVPIVFENGLKGFEFSFDKESSATTTVTLKGADKVISQLTKDDIKVSVDLSKIDRAGSFELPLSVEGKNKLATYELKNATVQVKATGSGK